ncbi:MAG TPA: hypothetical protein VF885_00580 [Arthrobacter sp.]
MHSDAVVALSPAADRLSSIATIRSHQLAWRELQDSLEAQRAAVDSHVRQAATASAAIEILEVLPQAAKIMYRMDGNEIVFVRATDAVGEAIVEEDDFSDPDSPWTRSEYRPLRAAVRRSEEGLEAAGIHFRGWLDVDVNDAISRAAARLG